MYEKKNIKGGNYNVGSNSLFLDIALLQLALNKWIKVCTLKPHEIMFKCPLEHHLIMPIWTLYLMSIWTHLIPIWTIFNANLNTLPHPSWTLYLRSIKTISHAHLSTSSPANLNSISLNLNTLSHFIRTLYPRSTWTLYLRSIWTLYTVYQ